MPKIIVMGAIMHMVPFTHKEYKEEHVEYEEFKGVYQQLQGH
jgi:hypothetical protein